MKDINTLPKTGKEFRAIYWLKEELVRICKNNNLPTSGSKEDLLIYITCLIDGLPVVKKKACKVKTGIIALTPEMKILKNYSNDENHRRFFIQEIGPHFKFNVSFMNWMKTNSGIKTYKEACEEYKRIDHEKKMGKKVRIGRQFEYNQYTRDFFTDNPGLTKDECIRCWKYKKEILGNHTYEKDDLRILSNP